MVSVVPGAGKRCLEILLWGMRGTDSISHTFFLPSFTRSMCFENRLEYWSGGCWKNDLALGFGRWLGAGGWGSASIKAGVCSRETSLDGRLACIGPLHDVQHMCFVLRLTLPMP